MKCLDAPLDTIVKRAGLGNATLYRHFPQRRDLMTPKWTGRATRRWPSSLIVHAKTEGAFRTDRWIEDIFQSPSEPQTILALRRTLGNEVAALKRP